MNLLMPSTIIQPRKRLSATRACIRTIPKMTPLVTHQSNFPREFLAAHVAGESLRPGREMQSLENGRSLSQVRVMDPYVPFLILIGREANRSEATVHGTRVRPVVPAVVDLAILRLVVAQVEELAQHALALEEVGAIVVLYRVIEPGI